MSTVGIDIGKSHHAVALCRDGTQEAERRVRRISSSRSGYDALEHFLAAAGPIERIVLESSGHYWMSFASALVRSGFPVALVNPLVSKYFGKRHLQRAKSDPADARTLAVLAMVDRPAVRDPLIGAQAREAARFAMTLIQEQARVLQRIERLVELGFPELEELFEDPTCRTALALLRVAPTAAVVTRKRMTTLAAANRGAGRRSLGAARATALRQLAAITMAPPELEPQMRFEMQLLLDQHDSLEHQIAQAEARVQEVLDSELARRLRTIPGVGPAIAAALIAEIGVIFRFDDFDQLVSYAGVHAAERSSGAKGASPETSWHMAKTGNAYLRAALYRMALVGTQVNPVIAQHYRRKRAAGKSKMNALGHCMKKALAIVWGVWRSGHDFVVPECVPS